MNHTVHRMVSTDDNGARNSFQAQRNARKALEQTHRTPTQRQKYCESAAMKLRAV